MGFNYNLIHLSKHSFIWTLLTLKWHTGVWIIEVLLYYLLNYFISTIIAIITSPLVSAVPLAHYFTASDTYKEELFYRKWEWLLYHMLFSHTNYHWYGINLFLCLHDDSSLWVDGICSVTGDNMEFVAVLSNDCPLAQK